MENPLIELTCHSYVRISQVTCKCQVHWDHTHLPFGESFGGYFVQSVYTRVHLVASYVLCWEVSRVSKCGGFTVLLIELESLRVLHGV